MAFPELAELACPPARAWQSTYPSADFSVSWRRHHIEIPSSAIIIPSVKASQLFQKAQKEDGPPVEGRPSKTSNVYAPETPIKGSTYRRQLVHPKNVQAPNTRKNRLTCQT